MTNNRIPKQVFFGELSDGKRARGRPKLRFKDLCKTSMLDFKIKPDIWEKTAADRVLWRAAMKKGQAECERENTPSWRTNDKEEKCQFHIHQICLVPTATISVIQLSAK